MTKRLLVVLGLALLTAGCGTERDSAENSRAVKTDDVNVSKASDPVVADPAELTYKQVAKEFNDSMGEFRKAIAKSKTPEEKQKAFEELMPKGEDYADRFMEVYEKHPESEFGVKSLLWITSQVQAGEKKDKAFAVLLKDHIDHEDMAMQAFRLQYATPSQKTEDNLNRLMTESSNTKVKGAASLAMAGYMKLVKEMREKLDDKDVRSDDEMAVYVKNSSFDEDDLLAQYKLVADKYADVVPADKFPQTLGEMANGALFEIENLGIGKLAPEIEAEDLEGVSFKLSDYRGDVVVIDFWGDW